MGRIAIGLWALVGAGAAGAASGPVATLTKVSGLVSVQATGSSSIVRAKTGTSLAAGDTVVVGEGRAELTFTEGHLVNLNANTTLRVDPPPDPAAQKRGIARLFAMLLQGSLKAIVKPVPAGQTFSIESAQAIASVKGTIFFFDGGIAQVRDEKDAAKHEVLVADLKTERSELVGEGQEGGFRPDGSVLDPHPIGDDVFDKLDHQFEAEEHAADSAAASAAAGTRESAADALRGELRDDLQEFSHSDDLANWSDVQTRRTDTELGKVLHDRHGDWVRMDESIVQTASNEVSLIVINERQTGPNTGVSVMTDDVFFNTDVPTDQFADIYRTYLDYLWDPTTYPPYFRTQENVSYRNPFGDHVRQEYTFDPPVLLWDTFTSPKTYQVDTTNYGLSHWVYYPDQVLGIATNWGQAMEEKLFVGTDTTDVLKEHYTYSEYGDLNAGWYAGIAVSPTETYPAGYVDQTGAPNTGQTTLWALTAAQNANATLYPVDLNRNDPASLNYFVGNPTLNSTQDFYSRDTDFGVDISGGAGFEIVGGYRTVGYDPNDWYGLMETHTYPDGTWLSQRFALIDDQGNELDPYGWYDKFNYEFEWNASEFSTDPDTGLQRSVDLVLDPDIFNSLHDSNTTSAGSANPNPAP